MKQTINSHILFLIILFLGFMCCQGIWAQKLKNEKAEIVFEGKLIDIKGNPIENAIINANQGGTIVLSNKDGSFKVKVTPNSELLIEKEGYESMTIKTIVEKHIITLYQDKSADEWTARIPVAYRLSKKDQLVGNILAIDVPQVLMTNNVSRFQSLIDTYGTGVRGGINLLGLGDALVVVDGLPRDPSVLMPEEIESISFLKDVNSAVLYGSQAKNGVIQIKTKRGVANKKVTQFSVQTGINIPIQLPKYLNSKDYLTLYSEAQVNDNPNKLPDYSATDIEKYNGDNPYRYPNVDYYGSDFLKSFYNSTRFVGEFSGGNKVASFYSSVGWEHQGQLYKSNTYNYGSDRLRVRGNVDYNITENISSHLDAAFVFDMANSPRSDFYSMASTFRPNDYTPLLTANMFDDPTLIDPLLKFGGNTILGGQSLISKNTYGKNIYGELNMAGNSKNYKRTMQLNTGVSFNLSDLTEGLKLNGDMSFDTYASFSEEIQNTYAVYEPIWSDITGKISGLTTINNNSKTGVLTLTSGDLFRNINAKIALDYDRIFNEEHHVTSSLFGYYSQSTVMNSLYSTKDAHIGIRAGYDYKGKYIADFSGALMNSVKLAPGNRVSFSPSLGLGWVISGEDFWNKGGIVDFLKLKVTGGILQTDASANFGYNLFREIYGGATSFATGDAGGYNFASIVVNQIANPNLGMEKMKNINLGVEAALFNKSVYLDASFYKTRYAGQVVQRFNYYPTLMSSFIPYENYNETDYSGFDGSITYNKKLGDFSILATFSLLYATSEYVKVDETHDNAYQYLVGTSPDAIRGLKFTGFFPTDAQAQAANQQFGTIRRGDMSYLDKDGNGVVNDNDNSVIGNYNPRFTEKFNLNLSYKNFSLFVGANAQLGYNWVMSGSYFWVDGTTKYSNIVLNRWTDATAATATYPRLTAQTSANNFRISDFWLRNGDSFSLSKVQLNYSFSQKLLKASFIKSASIYLTGDNLLFLAQDAELRQTNTYVLTRNFSLGLKMSF
ncbi:MAG: SusC/RagA family TonB-linked outer membrane protein [Bacteroidota bacterium]|nr:SusC/RagA family TonB-linked outer membrane protein [Bacteroidota bacterium]